MDEAEAFLGISFASSLNSLLSSKYSPSSCATYLLMIFFFVCAEW
jgi:hypothetical protein